MGESMLAASEQNRDVVKRFWAAMGANDFRAAGDCLHDDYVLDWPQSGERIRGRENFVAVNANYPAAGPWRVTVERLVADENGVASEVVSPTARSRRGPSPSRKCATGASTARWNIGPTPWKPRPGARSGWNAPGNTP